MIISLVGLLTKRQLLKADHRAVTVYAVDLNQDKLL